MEFETTGTTTAPADRVWSALVDVESWPRWTTSMTSVQRLDEGELRVGSRARIKQPGLPVTVWTVTELDPGRGFSWSTAAGGMRTVGYHWLAPGPDGRVGLILGIDQKGALAGLVALLFGARTRRYIGLELAGWKAASETVSA